jgi:hypothetical protein
VVIDGYGGAALRTINGNLELRRSIMKHHVLLAASEHPNR